MKFAKSAGWVFAGLMLAASGVYAQEVEQKARQLTEPNLKSRPRVMLAKNHCAMPKP